MELCIGIQAALACLAILSRIHFSKYKDGDIKGLKHIREEVQALRVLTRRDIFILFIYNMAFCPSSFSL